MATPTVSGTDPLAAGRAALERAAWEEARAIFEAATADGGTAEAWDGLSHAMWWLGDEPATLAARERAYKAYREAGDRRGAARMAMWLGGDHFDFHGDDAVAEAWLSRGRELVADSEPCAEQGWIALHQSNVMLLAKGDPAAARVLAEDALEVGREIGDTGVEMVALTMTGSAMVAAGEIEAGFERLARSVSMAVAESFEEAAAPGWTFCHTVTACADIGDFSRAEQWCAAMHEWSATWRGRQFFGICRTAYGEVLTTQGNWVSAEEELVSAVGDLGEAAPARVVAVIRLGRLRARQGKVDEARALFESAIPMPRAIVALGELDLEAGDPVTAAEAADRALRHLGEASVLERFPALELLARARACAGDADGAAAAAAGVEAEAERLGTPYMRGRAAFVRADVLAAAGDHDGARRAAEDAIDLFVKSCAPYDAALARTLLARSLEALGRGDRADAEKRAADEALALLGAQRTDAGGPRNDELTVREVEILRLVADGESDAEIAARLFLSPHTVHRHVANIRTKLRAPSRAAAVAHASRTGLI
jgi:ATP/maltotriose-dependent transcriptional regulator MalT